MGAGGAGAGAAGAVSIRLAGAGAAALAALAFVAGYQMALGQQQDFAAKTRDAGAEAAPQPGGAPPRMGPLAGGGKPLLQVEEEALWRVYGPYSRVAFTTWGRRTWVVPEAKRAQVAAAKRDLLQQYKEKVKSSYLATVGDFEMEWHLGLMAPANSTIVEIGTCHGWGAITIAAAMRAAGNGARLWSVDLYDKGKSAQKGWCATLKMFNERMQQWGLADSITAKCCSSLEVAATIPDGTLDGIFVDADHTFNAVFKDVEAWWPKLVPDGLMLGHDGFSHSNNKIVQSHLREMAHFFDKLVAGRDMLYHNPVDPIDKRGCPDIGSQGGEVTTGAMKYALPTQQMEFVCCVLNSSIWYFRRLPQQTALVASFGADGFKNPSDPLWPSWAGH